LTVSADGDVHTFDRDALLARKDVVEITTSRDVAYGTPRTYRAVALAKLLEGVAIPPDAVVEAAAQDGFVTQLPRDLVYANDDIVAYMAIEVADTPWPPIPGKDKSAGLLLTDARRASIVSCMANHSSHLDNVFSALADPTRRAIIARLSQGEASVGELAQPFDMALPSLMKHIRVLETGGLVESEKHGRVRTCRLMPGAMKGAENWLAEQRAIWEARLDRLESYVATLEKKPPRRRRRD
jgi:DNA-binding transcriptional ArsR family regulator